MWQMLKTGKQIKCCWNLSWCARAVQKEEQYSDTGIPDNAQDIDLESKVISIFSDIDVNVEWREVDDCHRIGKSNNGSKKTIIRFTNRKYRKHGLLNQKHMEIIIVSINFSVAQEFL